MTDTQAATPSAPETGSSEASASAPASLTKADLESIIDAKLSGLTSKYNGELASLRKAIKGGETQPAKPAEQSSTSSAAPASVTFEDLNAFREIGRLEAKLGDTVISDLGDEYSSASPREQLRLLKLVAKVHKPQAPKVETTAAAQKIAEAEPSPAAPAAKEDRGETPARTRQNVRGEPPAPRDGAVPRPTTRREFESLSREKRDVLMKDPSFNPLALPRR